ncbi:neuropilin-1a-like isoform X2 [Betta splendens]|uniref:Neuropilin-1a-like isoform X2 n=1 Tax=Betta splendens TaxID=158456 RepID=A0A8M1H6K7_BETSP|nr:neuropilin-1a-like isoform X2 [Betta splendens]
MESYRSKRSMSTQHVCVGQIQNQLLTSSSTTSSASLPREGKLVVDRTRVGASGRSALSSSVFTVADKCGGSIDIHSADYLTSPGYPSAYPPSQQCVWVITAPEQSQKILINFNPHFDLEDRDCKYDYVEVYNGGNEASPMVGKFCGKIAPSPIISTGNQLLIKFVSDYETHGAGFSVRYEVFKTGPECSRNFTAPRGVIKTPGFPERYPNNLDCTFMIFAPKMSEIVVEFDSFDMEPDTTPPAGALCRFDFLEIWDGFPAVGPHIGRYCGQMSPGQVISYTGILSMTITTDSAIAREGFSANYTIRERSLLPGHEDEEFHCMEPLGMESGDITPKQISASSQYNSNWSHERSRLNYRENGWTPSDDTVREWIQVDLGFLRFVTAIGTQGAISKETKKHYYVRSYKVDLSSNGEDWVTVKDGSKQKIFEGNQNAVDEFRSFFPKQTLTRYIRIRPMTWEQGICMRFEIYGCRTSDYPCSGMLGMVSGQVSDAQINASSYADRGWVPENARLLTGRSGWTGQQTKQPFKNEWLQVDLGQDKMLSGLVIQGGKHRDRNVFMKRFKVGHSRDGKEWTIVKEDNSTRPKIFIGNQNHDTPELRSVGPLLTRFVRIYPERATNEGLGLRLELLGCELDVITTTAPPTTPSASTLPMTTFGATTTAPITVPGTTAAANCEDGQQDCGHTDDYIVAEGNTAADPIIDFMPAYVWFACNFEYSSFCGWSSEAETGAEWLVQTNGAPSVHRGPTHDHTGGPGNFIYMQLTDAEVRSKTGDGEDAEEKAARLVSLPVTAPDADLCMSFWYHMFGEHTGALHIKQRKEAEGGHLLWTVSGHQGSRWREGRVLLPRSAAPYQVVVEGVADRRSTGHIAVDNIQIMDGLGADDCKDPEAPTSPPTEIFILRKQQLHSSDLGSCHSQLNPLLLSLPAMDSLSQDTGELGGPGNMLKTLDPILITIIAMSALGVFLGAICGVVLYCACSQGTMTERNLSALENYNFELVDGVKLKKDKMNGQNYSEA